MRISYNKLWKMLIDKDMTRTSLRIETGIATSTLARLGRNEPVSMDVLLRICEVLDCDMGDVVEFIKE